MNILTTEQLTPLERRKVNSTSHSAIAKDAIKAVDSIIKSRTQTLQQRILDGFLGIDDSDTYRVTLLIKKLMLHKPDLAIRLLTKMLPSLTDADIQKSKPPTSATINIVNQTGTPNQLNQQNSTQLQVTNISSRNGENQVTKLDVTKLNFEAETIDVESSDMEDTNLEESDLS